ncbi:MAG: 3-dehydroquinate dehydratase [Alphaproteobacteria bacterium]|jgi:3-dehydroquinate dehydratase-2|nr:3-dehydroquinate dehydratase [Alphaproteobacteria bacterium]
MTRVLVIQGANMDLLGIRQPEIYGTTTAAELDSTIKQHADERSIAIEILYTNSEAELMERTNRAAADGFDAIVCNTGSFCYSSYPIRDCFACARIPVIEVHMSNQLQRDIHSITAAGATGVIMGFGHETYLIGIDVAARLVAKNKKDKT